MGLNVIAVAGRRFQSPGDDGGTLVHCEAPGVGADLGAFRDVEVAVYDQRAAEEFDGGAIGIKRADRHSGHRRFGAVKYFEGGSRSGVGFKTGGVIDGVRREGAAADLDAAAEELLIVGVYRDGAAPLDEVACVTAHIAVEGEGCFVADFDGGFHVAVAHHSVIDPVFAPKSVVGRNRCTAVDGELRGTADARTDEEDTVACKLIVFALRDVHRQVVDRDSGRRLRISCIGVAVFFFPLAVDAFKVAAGTRKNHAGGAPRVGMHVEGQAFFKRGRVVIAHGIAEIRELPMGAVKLREGAVIERLGIEHHAGGRTGLGGDVDIDVTLDPEFSAFGVDADEEGGTVLLKEVLRVFGGRRCPRARHRDVEGCIPAGADVGGIDRFSTVFPGVGFKHDADARCGGGPSVKGLSNGIGFGERRDVDRFTREGHGGIAFEMKRVGRTGLGPLQGRSERRGVGRKKGLRRFRGIERAVGVGMVAVHQKCGSGVIRIFFGLIAAVDRRHPKRGVRARKRHRGLVEKNRVGACCDVIAVERETRGEILNGS